MATSSFDQKFVVSDKTVADKLRADMKSAQTTTAPAKDVNADKEKAIQLLRGSSN